MATAARACAAPIWFNPAKEEFDRNGARDLSRFNDQMKTNVQSLRDASTTLTLKRTEVRAPKFLRFRRLLLFKTSRYENKLITILSLAWCAVFRPSAPVAEAKVDRTVLPVAPPSFEGKIGVSLKDSTSEWPEMLKAPKGAPNVLLIMGDAPRSKHST